MIVRNIIIIKKNLRNFDSIYRYGIELLEEIKRERIPDLEDVEKRLISKLTGIENNILQAIIAKECGFTSHSSIIARGLGIPLITNLDSELDDLPEGTEIIIDGDNGCLILNPDEKHKAEMRRNISAKVHEDKNISIGSMIEVPSALLTVDQILSVSDFISIGTNDLNQYLTASDREILSVVA